VEKWSGSVGDGEVVGNYVEGGGGLYQEEARAAFELVERMYQEQIFKMDVKVSGTEDGEESGDSMKN